MQFKDISNQRNLANRLTEIIDSGRVSHAQMMLGATAGGSLAMALAYVQYLNCEHRQHFPEGDPSGLRADSCGECPNCKKIAQLVHPDLHLIFPSVTREGVTGEKVSSEDYVAEFRNFLEAKHCLGNLDDWYEFLNTTKQGMIRERDAALVERDMSMKAYEGGVKTFIIWMPEKMNLTVANKLLKSLEEPTENTLIMLVAEDTERLLPTIISRVQTTYVREPELPPTDNRQFAEMFVSWMRLLFKLNMQPLAEWVDKVGSMPKEQQKQFLRYSLMALRACFLKNMGATEMKELLAFGDEKFNQAFPTMITQNNIAQISDTISKTLAAIERNANSKLAFMHLSFRMSIFLKKR